MKTLLLPDWYWESRLQEHKPTESRPQSLGKVCVYRDEKDAHTGECQEVKTRPTIDEINKIADGLWKKIKAYREQQEQRAAYRWRGKL